MGLIEMVRVSLGGESVECPAEEWAGAADRLIKKYGGKPKVERIAARGVADVQSPTALAAPAVPTQSIEIREKVMTAKEIAAEINRGAVPGFANATARADGTGIVVVTPQPKGLTPLFASPRAKGPGLRIGSPLAVDTSQAARITLTSSETDAIGFAPPAWVFDAGGVHRTKASRPAWEAMPSVVEACAEHAARIVDEDRQDDVALATGIEMAPDGTIVVRHVDAPSVAVRYVLSEEAFGALVTRLDIPAAGRYLKACWPELRATNVNGWIAQLAATERRAEEASRSVGRASTYAPIDLRLRHRKGATVRDVFAIVSPSYGDFDSDKLDDAIARVVDTSAHARVTYDGRRTRWEITFAEVVQSEHSEEQFRPGVIITTDDGGGGAIRGQAFVRGVETRNVIHIPGRTAAFEIRHVGDISALAAKFRDGFGKARGAVQGFLALWGAAVEGSALEIIKRLGRVAGQEIPDDPDHAMAGVFRYVIDREIVPVRGVKTDAAVVGLMRAWRETPSLSAAPSTTRAAIVNAIATWAHTGLDADPWQEDLIQGAAGALLERAKKSNASTISLGYLAPEDVKGR